MPLWLPPAIGEYKWRLSSEAGVAAASTYGTSVTPGVNTKGSWAEVFSAAEIVEDVYFIVVNINSGWVQSNAKSIILDIGADPAGGTAYSVIIPDLNCAAAGQFMGAQASGSFWYSFPLFIPAGSSIAARASGANATPGTVRVWLKVFGRPKHPEMVKAGQYVTAFGIDAANSRGTLITAGGASEGSWVSLGTLSRDHWWWQVGFGANDTTLSDGGTFVDLAYGDATTKHLILEDQFFNWQSLEKIWTSMLPIAESIAEVPSGVELFMRHQGGSNSNQNGSAYGLGG